MEEITKENAKEWIIASAIWYDDHIEHAHQPVPTGFIICGHRHHNCLEIISILIPEHKNIDVGDRRQGFLTSLGRFVDRHEAYALVNGENPHNFRLFSEDIFPVGGV